MKKAEEITKVALVIGQGQESFYINGEVFFSEFIIYPSDILEDLTRVQPFTMEILHLSDSGAKRFMNDLPERFEDFNEDDFE